MSISKKQIESYKKLFGKRLKEIRVNKGMSQLDLASYLNVDKTSISRIENGRTNLTLITMVKLSKALDIRINELFDFQNTN